MLLHHNLLLIHSFILETYVAPLQDTQRRSQPVTAKEERLQGNVKFGRMGHQQGMQIIPC